MHIFLTGSSGFIGKHFLQYALSSGAKLTTVNRRKISKISDNHIVLQKNLLEVNYKDLEGIDVVVNLASPGVSPKKAPFSELFEINIMSSVNLMKHSKKAGVSRFICTGTAYEYGKEAEKIDRIPPDYPLKPIGDYAESKVAAFYILKNLAIEYGMIFLYPRIFFTYGKGQYEKNFWPSLYNAAIKGEDFFMTKGRQIFDFITVESVSEYLFQACLRKDVDIKKPLVYNVGSGEPISLYDFALLQWKSLGAKGRIIRGGIPDRPNQILRLVPNLQGLNSGDL